MIQNAMRKISNSPVKMKMELLLQKSGASVAVAVLLMLLRTFFRDVLLCKKMYTHNSKTSHNLNA